MDSILSESAGFNPAVPKVMHVDLNSCFASAEQQADHLLRGKPVAVAAYVTSGGCILTASYEAKAHGVCVGMRVSEGKNLCPGLIVVPPDPPKYRTINQKLYALMREYTDNVCVKSIDEMVLIFEQAPCFAKRIAVGMGAVCTMKDIATDIKHRIATEIGDTLRVSIGIAKNRNLAKIASEMQKPNGLTVIDQNNILTCMATFKSVEELTGIKRGFGRRLAYWGIKNALDFYRAPIHILKQAFHSIVGYHWWLRLHGWEADDRVFARKSIGHSYALYRSYKTDDVRIYQILCQLSEKAARRMRKICYQAYGVHLGLLYRDYTYWHKGHKTLKPFYSGGELYREARKLMKLAPNLPVRTIDVSSYLLIPIEMRQEELFEDNSRKEKLLRAFDAIQDRWGEFTLMPARMLRMPVKILDRIAFGDTTNLVAEEYAVWP